MKHRLVPNDGLLALSILIAAAACYLAVHAYAPSGQWAVIEQDGMELARLSLYESQRYPVITAYGSNIIQTGHGSVWMESSDCRDGICLQAGKLTNTAGRIVCLPHRLVIRVEGGQTSMDTMAR